MCEQIKTAPASASVVAIKVDTVQPVGNLFFYPGDLRTPAQRIGSYARAVVKAKGLKLNHQQDLVIRRMEGRDIFDNCRLSWYATTPEISVIIGVDSEYLYRIGDDGFNPPHPIQPAKVETKVEPAKLKTRILPGGIKRYVHVFAPALKERFDGKSKDNPLCCVRVGSNPKRFKMYRGVEFLAGASLEELAEPLAGTNGRAICVMVTTGPIRVSY